MKNKIIKILEKPKTIIPIILVIALIVGIFAYRYVGIAPKVSIDYKDANNSFQLSGDSLENYKDGEDVSLAFPKSGRISNVDVNTGDIVHKGQILAEIASIDAEGAVSQATGALEVAKANYEKILNGATGADIDVLKVAVSRAENNLEKTKSTQDTLVQNAYYNLLNSTSEAVPADGTSDYVAPTISGSYSLGKEGAINLESYYSTNGTSFKVTGLTSGSGTSNSIISQPIGDSGLYIKFPSTTNISVTNWVINIPNKKASNYLANYNAYQAAVKTQESALSDASSLIDQRTAELSLKTAAARGSDIDLAKADVVSAEGQLQGAQSKYDDTIIKSPANGTITRIDIKIGELASALNEVMVIQDISNIYIETNINEANITSLSVGMPVDINFDAFGPDQVFKGAITKIDPASTLVSGVVNYKVTASVEKVDNLRPGMTANLTINAKEKKQVIAVQTRAIITDKTGAKTIRLVTNTKTKSYKEVGVTTGLEGDGGLVEVTSGLSLGDEFIVLIK